MKLFILSLIFAFLQTIIIICSGSKPNGDEVKYVSLNGVYYIAYYEHGIMVEKKETSLTKEKFVDWAKNKGYDTNCK